MRGPISWLLGVGNNATAVNATAVESVNKTASAGLFEPITAVFHSHVFQLFLLLLLFGALYFAVTSPRQFFDIAGRILIVLGTVLYRVVWFLGIVAFKIFMFLINLVMKIFKK